MNIVSWNIQAGLGVDGTTSIDRVAGVIRALGDVDVICLQEVLQEEARPGGSEGTDQVAQLSRCFPGYRPFFGPAVDRVSGTGRTRFGNLMLSRLPVLQCSMHGLPRPADPSTRNMPRQAIEIVVSAGDQSCRIVTTHLEYFSSVQRSAQVDYLRALCDEAHSRARIPSLQGGEGLYAALPETPLTVLCGDFNAPVDSGDYRRLADGEQADALRDAWKLANPGAVHAPTCGIFDRVQWTEGAHCRDFFFVSAQLAPDVMDVVVDMQTDASDHQPIALRLKGVITGSRHG